MLFPGFCLPCMQGALRRKRPCSRIGFIVSRDNRQFGFRNAYEVGSPSPEGYIARQEWAAAQLRGGLRQQQAACGHWLFPQEESTHRCHKSIIMDGIDQACGKPPRVSR